MLSQLRALFLRVPPQWRAIAAAFIIGGAIMAAVGKYGVPIETAILIAGTLFATGGVLDHQIDGGSEQ